VVASVWDGTATAPEAAVAAAARDVLATLGTPWQRRGAPAASAAGTPIAGTPIDVSTPAFTSPADRELIAMARITAQDGQQRAADVEWDDPSDMEDARIRVRNHLGADRVPVQALIWRAARSGGVPLGSSGSRQGYELRFSRSKSKATAST